MTIRDWEEIYKTRGIVQEGVLFTVERAATLMNQQQCSTVLDLACGTGRHTMYLAEKGFNVFGLDISNTAIDITKNRLRESCLKNVTLKQGSMFNINFPDNYFDAVICVWSTGHGMKSDVKKNVEEMFRILKKGGIACADFMSIEDDNYMKGVQLEENTFLHDHIDHPDVPHHYSTLSELENFFSPFSKKEISPIVYADEAKTYNFKSFWVEAYK